ncbi:2-C-methyl-D-erythritol 2,4-cyclodiphosphate synthase [Candidatus Peregrinibacteria bacterium]|nr:2-C-methyl-D-erythritol 2,4-cyclodiphosphate synthase [Candidatus Peregrinibacteria bacterium]
MNIGLLLAAGKSKRFKGDKLFENLYGKPVIYYSLKFLEESQFVDEIFIAANRGNKKKIEKMAQTYGFKKVKRIFLGGKTRFESATKIIPHVFPAHADYFVIHNAANPFAEEEELKRCFKALKKGISGVAVGRKIHCTIKKAKTLSWDAPIEVEKTIPRQNLWEVETPQVVRARDFLHACKKINAQKFDYTDDLSILEAAGMKTIIVDASHCNRKITRPEDIHGEFAVGVGEDSHRFKIQNPKSKFQKLILGRIKIKNLPALEAESDGDVVLHALCNAISSAIGGGSLGTYATKMRVRGIRDSKKYLEVVLKKAAAKNFSVNQCAISIEAAKPKIDPLALKIKKSLSKLLKIPVEKIGITATSGEKLTPFGRGEAIKCQAVVLLSNLGARPKH